MDLYVENVHEDKVDKMKILKEKHNYNICKNCDCYKKELELLYGKVSGNCDIEDYIECDKLC